MMREKHIQQKQDADKVEVSVLQLNRVIKVLEQEPIGPWIIDIDESRRWDRKRFYCSSCGDWQTYGETKFCPDCGCAMERSDDR